MHRYGGLSETPSCWTATAMAVPKLRSDPRLAAAMARSLSLSISLPVKPKFGQLDRRNGG